jgi:putative oxidoreductase
MPAFIIFGRVLFAVLFIYEGAVKLFGIQAAADAIHAKLVIPELIAPYTTQLETLTSMQMPQLLAIAAGVFEIIAGVMVALNFGVRFFAILLILYVGIVTFYSYDFWNQTAPANADTLVNALKNLSLIGALFVIAGYGRGPRIAEPAYGDV